MGVEIARVSEGGEDEHWGTVVVPHVLHLVGAHLSQRDVCALLCVSASCHHHLTSQASLWKVLTFQGKANAGERLVAALSLVRYQNLEEINLEFAQGVDDKHLTSIACKSLQQLNLNACQKITDSGVIFVASANSNLKSFSIYWSLKVTDAAVECLVKACKNLTTLNISGCKNVTDKSLGFIANYAKNMQNLNLTRGVKLTDDGLTKLVDSCRNLEELYLYAVPSFTDRAYTTFNKLQELRLLDLCGAQNLTDAGLTAIAECKDLASLNLTWCINITDVGLKALGRHCSGLQLLSPATGPVQRLSCPSTQDLQYWVEPGSDCWEYITLSEQRGLKFTKHFASLHGILGVSDEGVESLAACCCHSLTALDVHGCLKIKRRSKGDLLRLFPKLKIFQIHS